MPGHVCTICASSALTKRAVELIAQRVKDRDAAVELGLGDNDAGRMIYNRHRRNCVEKFSRKIVEASNKGRQAFEQKKEIIEKAEKGELNPIDFLSMGALTTELRRIATRIENASTTAERNGQLTALAALTGQQIRQVETRAKLAGHGGFAAAKNQVAIGVGGAAFQPFVLRMNLSDRTETLILAPQNAPHFEVRDAETGEPFDPHSRDARDLMFVPPGSPAGVNHTGEEVDHDPSSEHAAAAPDALDELLGTADVDDATVETIVTAASRAAVRDTAAARNGAEAPANAKPGSVQPDGSDGIDAAALARFVRACGAA